LLVFMLCSVSLLAQHNVGVDTTHNHAVSDSLAATSESQDLNLQGAAIHIDSLMVRYFFAESFIEEEPKYHIEDTTLITAQLHNPAKYGENFYQTLGNLGQATNALYIDAPENTFFDYGIHSYDLFRTTPSNQRFYESPKPYTILDYTQGPSGDRREAILNVDHSQPLADKLTVGLKLYINSSLGDYDRQKAADNQFSLNIRYRNKSDRYGALASYIRNRQELYDNGGIKYDTVFENNEETDRKLYAVNLTTAESWMVDSWVTVHQYFHLVTPANDKFSLGKIGIDSYYNRQIFQYIDSDPSVNYYPKFYNADSTYSFDSTSVTRIKNDIFWSNKSAKKNQMLVIRGGWILENISLNTGDSIRHNENHFTTYGQIKFRPDSATFVYGRVSHTTGTFNTDDLGIYGQASRQFSFGLAEANFDLFSVDPAYQMISYYSSHFAWNNPDFQDIMHLQARLKYSLGTLKAGIQYNSISHYTYINQDILPMQAEKPISLLRAWVYKDFTYGKFNISGKAIYQTVSNHDVIRLPEFMGKMSFQFYQPLFKKALHTQFGFDVLYTTKFYGNEYMPAIKQFYLQDNKLIGNYPFVDAYIKFQVKRARIYVMFTHINSGLMNYNYYMTPGYPMRDRYFKFGVSWFFHD